MWTFQTVLLFLNLQENHTVRTLWGLAIFLKAPYGKHLRWAVALGRHAVQAPPPSSARSPAAERGLAPPGTTTNHSFALLCVRLEWHHEARALAPR